LILDAFDAHGDKLKLLDNDDVALLYSLNFDETDFGEDEVFFLENKSDKLPKSGKIVGGVSYGDRNLEFKVGHESKEQLELEMNQFKDQMFTIRDLKVYPLGCSTWFDNWKKRLEYCKEKLQELIPKTQKSISLKQKKIDALKGPQKSQKKAIFIHQQRLQLIQAAEVLTIDLLSRLQKIRSRSFQKTDVDSFENDYIHINMLVFPRATKIQLWTLCDSQRLSSRIIAFNFVDSARYEVSSKVTEKLIDLLKFGGIYVNSIVCDGGTHQMTTNGFKRPIFISQITKNCKKDALKLLSNSSYDLLIIIAERKDTKYWNSMPDALKPNLPDVEFKITRKLAQELFGDSDIIDAVTRYFHDAFPEFGLKFVLVQEGKSGFTMRCKRIFQSNRLISEQWLQLVEHIESSNTFSFAKPQKVVILTILLFYGELQMYQQQGVDFYTSPLNPETSAVLDDVILYENEIGELSPEQQAYNYYNENNIDIDARCPIEEDEELLVYRLALFNVVKLILTMF
jgi:hypothetical protein